MASDLSLIALDDPSRRLTLLDLDEESPRPRRPLTPYRDEPDLLGVGEVVDTPVPVRRVQSTSTVSSASASDAQAGRTVVARGVDGSQLEPQTRKGQDEAFLIKLGDGSSVVFRPPASTGFNSPKLTHQRKPIKPPSQLQQQVHNLLKHSSTVIARDTLQVPSASTCTLSHHSSLSSPVLPLNPSRTGSSSISLDLAHDPPAFSPLPTPEPWDTAPSSIDESLETVEGTIISDKAIIPHTTAEVAGLFDWLVTPLPFPKLDYPVCVKAGPKYKKGPKKGEASAVAVVVAAQKQEQGESTTSPGKRKRENDEDDIQERLDKVLVKYGAAAPSTLTPEPARRQLAITFTETPSNYTPSDIDVESQIDYDLDDTDSSDIGVEEDLLDLDEQEQEDLLGPIYADEYHDNDDNAGEYEQSFRALEETEHLVDLALLGLEGSDAMSSRGRGARQTAMRGRKNQYTAESHSSTRSQASNQSAQTGFLLNVFDEETLSTLGGRPARSSRFPDYPPEIRPPWDRLCALRVHDPIRPIISPEGTDWPEHLSDGDDELQNSIIWSWHHAEITAQDEARIDGLLDRLTEAVNMQLGGYEARQRALDPLAEPRFMVDLFGSMSWGGQTGKGDIDLVIRDREYPQGYEPSLWTTPPGGEDLQQNGSVGRSRAPAPPRPNLPPIYDLRSLVGVLRRMGMTDVFGIYNANTPIVKFVPPGREREECDINVNDLGGWYNSALIQAYCEASPLVLRPLIHALKLWGSAQEVKDQSGKSGPATMSSYCLTLMAIAYLQIRGALPNLQAGVPEVIPGRNDEGGENVIWVGWKRNQGVKAHVGFDQYAPRGWRPRDPELTAAEALRGFFAFFSRTPATRYSPRFNPDTQVVSVRNGGIMPRTYAVGSANHVRAEKGLPPLELSDEEMAQYEKWAMGNCSHAGVQPSQWDQRPLLVQDPFIWQKNCTQAASVRGLERWWTAVDYAHDLMIRYGAAATIEDLTEPFDPLPIRVPTPRMPTPGRGSPGFGLGRGRGGGPGRGRAGPGLYRVPDGGGFAPNGLQ